MEYKITMADICELAHEYTVKECAEKGITLDKGVFEDGEEDEEYTDEAQAIYDRHYLLITNTLGV
jgi:hypothetical protein